MEKIIGLPEMYKQYKKDYTENPYELTQLQFNILIKDLAMEMRENLLLGKEIKLPMGLGKFLISRNRFKGSKKNSIIDWEKTKIVGKRITFHNIHSNDYVMGLKWCKYKSVVKNKSYYTCKTMRTFRAKMAEYMKSHSAMIYIVT